MTTPYTDAQKAHIAELEAYIADNPVPLAVVDYEGTIGADLQVIGADHPERFGVRDMRHVRIYNLTVVSTNQQ